jgi:Xaa-Pro dipeptidase
MTGIYALRLDKLKDRMDEKGLDGIVLGPGPNLKYYTGCDALLEERVLLFFITSRGENHLLASKFDLGPFRNSPSEMVIHEWDEGDGPSRAFKELTRALPLGDLWGHETRVPFQFLNEMMKYSEPVWMEAEPILQNMREVKEEGEIRVLKKAASILVESALQITEMLEPGMTEAELSRRLNAEIFSRGADSVYGVNVQAGERGGDPELLTSSRKIGRMEPVTIDISCTYSGYLRT